MTKKSPIDEAKSGTAQTTADAIKSAFRTRFSSLIVLVVGLIVTGAATLYMQYSVERIAEQAFVANCTEIQNKIVGRLFDHARILRSTQAFVNASDTVTREKWNIYTRLQKLEQQLPGIQGIGFSLLIPRKELARHIQKIRSEGFPKYKIKPEGERESYSSIIYLEPFDWRNQRAFGYDMLTEPVRRAAMEKSRDEDMATLSGKVLLVQEADTEVQAGNLMYVPVYRKGMPTDTAEQRRAAIYGWVYSPYRMNDLMRGILGKPNPGKQHRLFLDVFDGEKASPQSLLYEEHLPKDHQLRTNVHFTKQMPVEFNSHRWTLTFTQADAGVLSVDYIRVWLVMLGGTLITLLLTALIRTLQNTAAVAQRFVDERTVQLVNITNELKIIVENAPIGISKIIDRKQVWVNRKMKDLFQYSRDEMQFQSIRKLYTSDEAYEKLGQEAYPVLSQGQLFETVQELIRKDGTHLLIRYIAKAVEPSDMSKGSIWLLEDVTERMRNESKLLLHNEIMNNLAEGVNLIRLDDNRIVFANPRFEKMFGYDPGEILGKDVTILNTPGEKSPEGLKNSILEILAETGEWHGEVKNIKKDGTHFWCYANVSIYDHPDYGKVMLSVHTDITERKQFEDAVTGLNKLLQAIINNAPMRIFWKDLELRYLGCNKLFAEDAAVGCPDDLIGKDDHQLTWKDQAQLYRADDMCVIKSGIPKLSYEEPQTNPDGDLIWLRTSKVPLYNESEEIIGILGMYEDITERKRAEEEKHALEQQLHQAQKMESLGVLAGGIAHDFNNILAVIMCYSSLGQQKPEKAAEFMEEINKASERAAGLCRQMLAYAGKTQFVQSSVDMTALVDEILNMLKETIPRNVTIRPYLTGDIPQISGDASQLRQIVMNLMINASEAIGEEQGDIRVALTKTIIGAEREERDRLGKAISPGIYLCLEVTDTGCGMVDETRQRIFEPFYSTKFVGRGLGMSAVLGVVTSHKGALQLTSQPGQGATVKIYLPVKASDTSVEQTEPIAAAHWQGSGTILLVEDEPQLMDVAKALLETIGFKVIGASNGIEALEQYRKNASEIRLVLTDIGMPLMNGYQLIRELKKINPMLPIIVSSGFGDTIVTSRIAPGDIVGGISKPYRFEQLREVLKGIVEGTESAHT